jgi:hypothetical protein
VLQLALRHHAASLLGEAPRFLLLGTRTGLPERQGHRVERPGKAGELLRSLLGNGRRQVAAGDGLGASHDGRGRATDRRTAQEHDEEARGAQEHDAGHDEVSIERAPELRDIVEIAGDDRDHGRPRSRRESDRSHQRRSGSEPARLLEVHTGRKGPTCQLAELRRRTCQVVGHQDRLRLGIERRNAQDAVGSRQALEPLLQNVDFPPLDGAAHGRLHERGVVPQLGRCLGHEDPLSALVRDEPIDGERQRDQQHEQEPKLLSQPHPWASCGDPE